jgi:outer membrane murein-binding lipoprotein Lpp
MEILVLFAFVAGYLVSWIQWYQPELKKVRVQKVLTSVLQSQTQKLESDLKRARSKVQALELDLARQTEKTQKWAKETVQEIQSGLPQQNLSYWKFEGPKLKQRVLDLEMELEYLRSKTVWKQD